MENFSISTFSNEHDGTDAYNTAKIDISEVKLFTGTVGFRTEPLGL
jgi:hypothetical protein